MRQLPMPGALGRQARVAPQEWLHLRLLPLPVARWEGMAVCVLLRRAQG